MPPPATKTIAQATVRKKPSVSSMLEIVLLLGAIVLVAVGLVLVVQAKPSVPASPPPLFELMPPGKIDLGSIRQGETKEIEFRVRNNSAAEVIEVQAVPQSSCSCLKVENSKIHVDPKSEGIVRLTFSPTKEDGPVVKRLYFVGSIKATHLPISLAEVTAKVQPEFQLSDKILNFAPGEVSKEVKVIDGFRRETKILSASPKNVGVNVRVSQDGRSMIVDVDRAKLLDAGTSPKEILVTTSSTVSPTKEVFVYVLN